LPDVLSQELAECLLKLVKPITEEVYRIAYELTGNFPHYDLDDPAQQLDQAILTMLSLYRETQTKTEI
jgi:hypothetical protein